MDALPHLVLVGAWVRVAILERPLIAPYLGLYTVILNEIGVRLRALRQAALLSRKKTALIIITAIPMIFELVHLLPPT